MKLPDVNLWLALAVSSHPHHAPAKAWMEKQDAPMSLVFCRMTQQGYLRLLTETALMRHYQLPPRTNAEAWATWEVLRDDYRVIFRSEPEGLEERWKRFGARSTASSKLWMDAYLAAFAVTTNSQMVTFDKGFKQFGELNLLLLSA